MSPECKTNRGNLMQHWTLCEALTCSRVLLMRRIRSCSTSTPTL